MVSVGDMAPDFELMAFDKNMVRLSDSIGNRVVLLFYPAAFTGVCTKEMCTVSDSMNRMETAEAEVFGISVDLPMRLLLMRMKSTSHYYLIQIVKQLEHMVSKSHLLCQNIQLHKGRYLLSMR